MCMQNGTLQDVIDHVYHTGVLLEERQILQLFVSVCRGIHAMHNCGIRPIAHNDIKVRIHWNYLLECKALCSVLKNLAKPGSPNPLKLHSVCECMQSWPLAH